MAGSSPFSVMTNIFVTEFAEFSEAFRKNSNVSPVNQHGAGDKRKVEIDPSSCCSDMSANLVNSMKIVHIFGKTVL